MNEYSMDWAITQSTTTQGTLFDVVGTKIVFTNVHRKRCARCEEVKPLEAFHPSRVGKYGREPRCSQCDYERKQTPEYREFERNRKAAARAARPMMEPLYSARRRIRLFNEQKREFDSVP